MLKYTQLSHCIADVTIGNKQIIGQFYRSYNSITYIPIFGDVKSSRRIPTTDMDAAFNWLKQQFKEQTDE